MDDTIFHGLIITPQLSVGLTILVLGTPHFVDLPLKQSELSRSRAFTYRVSGSFTYIKPNSNMPAHTKACRHIYF
jgi:hypothetical protein